MNHPLVRRKFGATFSFFPPSRGRGTAIGSWKTWKGVAVWRYTYCTSFLSLGSLSDIPRFFLPLSPSARTRFFFFHISCVIFFHIFTSLIRFPPSTCRVSRRISIFPFFCFYRHSFFRRLVPLFPRTLVPSRSEIGLGTEVDIGSIRDLPRATITCNTVGLSGPMGTRWGVLSVRKKDITVTHIESGAAPLRGARSVALVLSQLTCLMICRGPLFN